MGPVKENEWTLSILKSGTDDDYPGHMRYAPIDVTVTNSWSIPSSQQWLVRGPDYLKQSAHMVLELKQPSLDAPYSCIGMNVFRSPMPLMHASDKIMDFRRFLQEHCNEEDDTGMPKFMIMCFLFSNFFRTEFYCVHQVFRRTTANKGEDPALDATVARFMAGDDNAKNGQFKYMLHVVEAPQVLTGVISSIGGERPVLIGKRLTTNYFRGKNYLEIGRFVAECIFFRLSTNGAIDMDLSSSIPATMAISVSLVPA